jgi:hypothetical protein
LVPVPAVCFFLSFLAVTFSIFPLAFGKRKQKISAIITLLLGIALAVSTAGQLRNDPYYKKQRPAPPVQQKESTPQVR